MATHATIGHTNSGNCWEITGGTKVQREMVNKVTKWFIEKYLPRYRTLCIYTKLTSIRKHGAEGYCMAEDDYRTFEIEIEKDMSLYDMCCTVIHELIHVKQYARKEMTYKNGKTYWKGRDCTDKDYWDQPWEKEAFKLQDQYTVDMWKDNIL